MKHSKSAIRLDPGLVHEAEMEALIHKRTTPKQIEYWAEIGKKVSELLDPTDLLAVTQGIARLEVKDIVSYPLSADKVFERVAEESGSGYLSAKVTAAKVSYEAHPSLPGLLLRINEDGSTDAGHFKNGKFIKIRTKHG